MSAPDQLLLMVLKKKTDGSKLGRRIIQLVDHFESRSLLRSKSERLDNLKVFIF